MAALPPAQVATADEPTKEEILGAMKSRGIATNAERKTMLVNLQKQAGYLVRVSPGSPALEQLNNLASHKHDFAFKNLLRGERNHPK